MAALALLVFIVWWTMFSGRRNGERAQEATDQDRDSDQVGRDAAADARDQAVVAEEAAEVVRVVVVQIRGAHDVAREDALLEPLRFGFEGREGVLDAGVSLRCLEPRGVAVEPDAGDLPSIVSARWSSIRRLSCTSSVSPLCQMERSMPASCSAL